MWVGAEGGAPAAVMPAFGGALVAGAFPARGAGIFGRKRILSQGICNLRSGRLLGEGSSRVAKHAGTA